MRGYNVVKGYSRTDNTLNDAESVEYKINPIEFEKMVDAKMMLRSEAERCGMKLSADEKTAEKDIITEDEETYITTIEKETLRIEAV